VGDVADPASPAYRRPDAGVHGPRYRWDPVRGRTFKIIRLREDLEGNVAELAIDVGAVPPDGAGCVSDYTQRARRVTW
jgi:hypothetical protein